MAKNSNILRLLTKKNKYEYYYDINTIEEANKIDIIRDNKDILINRKCKSKFTEDDWFTFGIKRNIKIISEHMTEQCIYVYNQSREHEIAFIGEVNYFGGNLMLLLPKTQYKNINLINITNYLNSDSFREQYTTDKNRFRISHKQLATSYIEYKQ